MKVDHRDPLVHIAMGAELRVEIWEGTDRPTGLRCRKFAGTREGRDAARWFIHSAWQRPETFKVIVRGETLVLATVTCTADGSVNLRLPKRSTDDAFAMLAEIEAA